MAKKPFINKYGFVEYPFLHDKRKEENWWFYNLLEDFLKLRSRQKYGPVYDKEVMEKDMLEFLHLTNLKFFVLLPSGMGMEFKLVGKYATTELIEIEDPVPFIAENFGGGKFKVNIYLDGTYAGTQNYKTHGDPKWVEIADDNLTG
jgi:hypothetical protein